ISGGGNNSGTIGSRNAGYRFMIPTQDEWYKAAFYKGGGTSAGYWRNAMQSDSATPVVATSDASGNPVNPGPEVANHQNGVDWNGQDGHVSTVGGCGAASTYGTFDQSGNLWEWNETISFTTYRVIRGGCYDIAAYALLSSSGNFAEDSGNRLATLGLRIGR
ncbi:MAG TPA: SUMF1/EgtB/PvdO family nonheme iron enzyme, partial [Candidatus Ozemobacteraceae bacterium]|nr:SUMF1/EgtB/PvdO family nonheme iron enzyme [Candidatus Ozemobacteraceae bacterium]